jgi:hypothetical protein
LDYVQSVVGTLKVDHVKAEVIILSWRGNRVSVMRSCAASRAAHDEDHKPMGAAIGCVLTP